jgi:hypothetical protein
VRLTRRGRRLVAAVRGFALAAPVLAFCALSTALPANANALDPTRTQISSGAQLAAGLVIHTRRTITTNEVRLAPLKRTAHALIRTRSVARVRPTVKKTSARALATTKSSVAKVVVVPAKAAVPPKATVPVSLPAAVHIVARVMSRPSWWSGQCDANHWNRIAALAGFNLPGQPTVPVVGAYATGASYLGVPVCGPMPGARYNVGGHTYTVPDVRWSMPNSWGYPEWQCTELAFRFMRQVYGASPYAAAGGTVAWRYTRAQGGGLVTYRNGAVGHAPQPGDVISFSGTGGYGSYDGHVAIVASTTVNQYGNGWLRLLTEHDTMSGWRTVSVWHWRVANMNSNGTLPAWGWLHDPLGRGHA